MPRHESNPQRPTRWPIVVMILYIAGLVACAFAKKPFIPCAELWTCALILPTAIILGIKFGTQDKDLWT